jgi:hypothetical protein
MLNFGFRYFNFLSQSNVSLRQIPATSRKNCSPKTAGDNKQRDLGKLIFYLEMTHDLKCIENYGKV